MCAVDQRERELRKVLLIMLEAFNKYQTAARAQSATLAWIAELPKQHLATLSSDAIGRQVRTLSIAISPKVLQRATQLKSKLESEDEFLEALRIFASQEFWPNAFFSE